ncbi:MAG TPA: hypothetical protein VIW73_08785 [Candidatus Cybelea sp.]
MEEPIKATFLLTPSAKYRLVTLKARLRREGINETESSLLERLLAPGYISTLEEELKPNVGQKKAK